MYINEKKRDKIKYRLLFNIIIVIIADYPI